MDYLVLALVLCQTPMPRAQEAPQLLPSTILNTVTLPREENLETIDNRSLRVQHLANKLVITVGNKVFREFNPLSDDAEATVRLLRELQVVRWGVIGKSRPVVEYGLTVDARGELIVPPNSGFPKTTTAFDKKSLKVSQVRGAWCVQDANAVLLNFGIEKQEAEQAVAVCQKYGFNRIGTIGKPTSPAVTYFYIGPETAGIPLNPLDNSRRLDPNLTRTGIEVPGLGFLGEKIILDVKKLEVRREPRTVTLRQGNEVIASFEDEWTARDAVRLLEQARYTEFCRYGSATFFLKDGKAPTQVPFLARCSRFDASSLQSKMVFDKLWVVDVTGRKVFPAADENEAKELIKVIRAFGFDTHCQIGTSQTHNLQFLAKTR